MSALANNQLILSPGAGNIGSDSNTYADGGIVREGTAGESERAEYSAGRGGAGNILPGSPRPGTSRANTPLASTAHVASEEDIVPETATRSAEGHENFHTGRGGGGNVHKEKYGGHSTRKEQEEANGGAKGESLLDRVKGAIGLDQKK